MWVTVTLPPLARNPSPRVKVLADGTKVMTAMHANAATRALGRSKVDLGIEDLRTHDLRRTAATGMARLGHSLAVPYVLAHKRQDVTGIYDQYGYVAEKRAALDAWGTHLEVLLGLPSPAPAVAVVATNIIQLPVRAA